MLARANRLTRGADYRAVVRRGRRCASERLIAYTVHSYDDGPSLFGFIVSKQVGTAVVRNTVRRRLKAACADLLPTVPAGTRIVIRALPDAAAAPFAMLAADITRCVAGGTR